MFQRKVWNNQKLIASIQVGLEKRADMMEELHKALDQIDGGQKISTLYLEIYDTKVVYKKNNYLQSWYSRQF